MRKKPSTPLTEKSLAALDTKKLAHFLYEYALRDPLLFTAAEHLVQYSESHEGMLKLILNRIKGISSGQRSYFRSDARELDHEVYDIVRSIEEELALVCKEDAVTALQFLAERSGAIIESVDTSDGTVYPHLQYAVSLLGQLWAKIGVKEEPKLVARYVLDKLNDNGYGVFDYIIEGFKDVLGDSGYSALEKLFRKSITNSSESDRKERLVDRLKNLADAQNDPDKYIALTKEFPSKHQEYEHLEVAKRLAAAGRAEEALDRMQHVTSDSISWKSDVDKTLLMCYKILGRHDDAYDILEQRFIQGPSKDTLKAVMQAKRAKKGDRDSFVELAISKSNNVYTLVDFLTEIKDVKRLAAIVCNKHKDWDGDAYGTLQPAANLLEVTAPLEATILYRALIDSILTRAKSKYYYHAARYLGKLSLLATLISDFSLVGTHVEYLATIRELHKRKPAFLALLEQEDLA